MANKNNFFPLPDGFKNEEMEADVLIVGGGSAGLSCAFQIQKEFEKLKEKGDPSVEGKEAPMIIVLEKASEVGAHSFSGAVLNPIALKELLPNFKDLDCPLDTEVVEDAVYYLTQSGGAVKFPVTPPQFNNHGNYIVSISKLNRWLASQCEQKGINIFPGFAAVEALYEGDKIIGVRTGDKGRDQNGEPKANFEPGILIKAKVTIFAEGTRGSLFKSVSKKLSLREGKNPEVFEEGVKEIIQCAPGSIKPGQVIHTMGFPLSKSIGGTFMYTLPGDKVLLGLVAYLDTKDPLLDPHRELQKLKTHPFINNFIKGGSILAYGGKTLPAGGWFSMPKLYGQGWMVVGDSASMVDVQKLKGIHHSMKSGMLAGETALAAWLANDVSASKLSIYESKINASYVKHELYKVRNFHQTLSKGILKALPLLAIQEITGGKGLQDNMPVEEDAKTTEKVREIWGTEDLSQIKEFRLPSVDGKLYMDKLSSVYLTGTSHDEHSPNHLLLQNGDVCSSVCEPKYRSPCTHFCPAAVYEMIPSEKNSGQKELKINYTNCIHCKTCDIKCPFENIDWTPPEGGGGPKYLET
ncbi:MAG: electron transfer flavoprotein-ubiquinone oxidoreductase [Bdellovibrionaceae bacterium]|nr:electron transfer flavoprotein-ubiquinone oxidoreductase [Pseudobdellovibrionaceae bacterium]NUM58911.1 electron transfer flavoprotein-ubiquinone oxidoreductase [Pseudobdellovibrionaceae bacterium]